MTVFRIDARFLAQPPAADWREQLATRLGSRPRRLGLWAELGLYGALECLAAKGETCLPEGTALLLSSRHGPAQAVQSAMAQAREGLPMPLTFLQTQPSQLLAALSAQLHWRGDARFITQPDPLAVLALAMAMATEEGLLLGWVDEMEIQSSLWLRLQPVTDSGLAWHPASSFDILLQQASHVRLGRHGVDVSS
jgi:hypothetical protein